MAVGETNGLLACQLFNSKGVNNVEHGNGSCSVLYGGGVFVWARVYNQAGLWAGHRRRSRHVGAPTHNVNFDSEERINELS
jgi:hypothetical protein